MGKTDFSITHQMHLDLVEAYKQVAGACWTQRQAYERMVLQPAPRFYVTPKQAYQIIAPMVRGDFNSVNLMMPMRRKMYYELYGVVINMIEQKAFIGKSLWHIMQYAVLQPASRFYITPDRARIIRYWVKNGVFDDEGHIRAERLPSYYRSYKSNQSS